MKNDPKIESLLLCREREREREREKRERDRRDSYWAQVSLSQIVVLSITQLLLYRTREKRLQRRTSSCLRTGSKQNQKGGRNLIFFPQKIDTPEKYAVRVWVHSITMQRGVLLSYNRSCKIFIKVLPPSSDFTLDDVSRRWMNF